jgi:2-oxo-3-hexenedioate decarboxylase
MADVIADNTSAAGVVIGEERPDAFDLPAIRCSLRVNGPEVATATGADVLGDPKRALAWAVEQAERVGRPLQAGMIVLSGGMTDFVPLRPGELVEADFGELGGVSVSAS